jgi:ABC-type polysaccharide/polyol phosphate export permease
VKNETATAAAPPPELRYRRPIRVGEWIRELWTARQLVFTLAERDFRVRYKQTMFGAAWAIVVPLILMVAFTLFFSRAVTVDTKGVPYPLFSYIGLIPWSFFSTSVSSGGLSIRANSALLTKLYCPREVFPMATTAVAGIDMAISILVLGVLFVIFGFAPKATTVWVPMLLILQVVYTLGITLFVAAVVMYFRDLRQALPLMLQIGIFATPVAWGIETVPSSLRGLYAAINPLAPIIDGYRRTVLFGETPEWELLSVAAAGAVVVLVGGYLLFKRLEIGFADVA